MAQDHVRDAWVVSVQTVVWTSATSTVLVVLGLLAGSAVLVAFGAVGLVDGAGSVALAYHFRHALHHEAFSEHLESVAHQLVLVGLLVVGAGAVVGAGVRLATGAEGASSAVGTGLAVVSFVVLVALSRRKRRLARLVQSPALLSDSHLSAVGAAEALLTLAGAATARLGQHWADPVAAAAVGCVAIGVSLQGFRDRRTAARHH